MSKPFSTIEEQIAILQSRGIKVDENTASILLRENYYCVVNGYKEFFLDDTGQVDSFKPGTTFMDIYTLFLLDRELRHLFFHKILIVEAMMKTVIAYYSCEHYKDDPLFYLDRDTYEGKKESIEKLLAMLQRCYDDDRENISHYRTTHGHVPFWVLVNNLNFGTLSWYFKLLKPRGIKQRVVNNLAILCSNDDRPGVFTVEKLSLDLRVLVEFRNVCAHNERFYCHVSNKLNIKPESPATIASLFIVLGKYLSTENLSVFTDGLLNQLGTFVEGGDVSIQVVEKIVSSLLGEDVDLKSGQWKER